MRSVKKDSTDQSVVIRIIDSTDGTPENAVEHNTAGIDLWYRREGATKTSIVEVALAALDSVHLDGGIELIGDGYYRLDPPDAAFATGANGVMIGGTVTGMIVIGTYIPLVDYDPHDTVRLGLTALPNADADAAGGLPISDAGGLDLDTKLANTNEITAARMGALTDLINGERLDLIIDQILADTNELQTNQGAWVTATGFSTHTAANVWAVGTRALTDKAGFALSTAGIKAIWDRILTGATHNIPTSAGRRVREIGAFAIHSGTAQAGNSHSITLAASADANNGVYNRNLLVLTDNTGVGQTRTIVDYDGTTKVAVIDRDWYISPDATTAYQITPDDTPLVVDHGLSRGGTANTITLRAIASAVDDNYLCSIVTIIAGTGRGQARLVGSYDGTTKVVTICGEDWPTTPDTTSVYIMMPYGAACVSCISPDVLRDLIKTAGVLL